ncbi:AI-2E family transporter [Clostridium sp. YIM B02505]|uniref:AI-2E family transporter n=1 Tax=Clostridium yunnanense TaxID=2800325 RepID=A0ABS1EPG8_9CLOT|nr:AI-2E family transporter [Clostridium yunnanense]MBK1811234.1 AI-2E family transporter [Clostridium yunnanense]
MKKRKLIYNLLIINLVLLAIFLYSKVPTLIVFAHKITKVVLVPVIIGVFFFYLVKPLNDFLLKKGVKNGIAAMLTLIIAVLVLSGFFVFLGSRLIREFQLLISKVSDTLQNDSFIKGFNDYFTKNLDLGWVYEKVVRYIETYVYMLGKRGMRVFSYAMNLFSVLLLILVIIFYQLKDGLKFKESIIKLVPDKYKDTISSIMSESNKVLSSYVTGQACVALSLSIMVYIGYKIVGMPSALILASTTFILAFIPFVGFFVSMIIPYIIAISVGLHMIIKLTILFMIAQGVKGRIVVPLIMAKAMKIHPLTDIFLVIAAATLIGPLGAFAVVPIYAVFKVILVKLNLITSDNKIIYNEKKQN